MSKNIDSLIQKLDLIETLERTVIPNQTNLATVR